VSLAPSDTAVRFDDQVDSLITDLRTGGDAAFESGLPERLNGLVAFSTGIATAAFDHNDPEALDQAHRALYSLYGLAVWNAGTTVDPETWRQPLGKVRGYLEQGLRRYLERRRIDLAPPADASLEQWMEDLALRTELPGDVPIGRFINEQIEYDQLREIVAQRSLFFLREPDPWIYAVPTLTGPAKAGLIDLLLDEYGWGKLDRMHSSIYAVLMERLELNTEVDHYERHTSWQYLATLNYQWMVALDTAFSRRLLGVVYLTEADSPLAMTNYLAAWDRLGVTDELITEFYDLHVHADENHRDVALKEVVMPVCAAEPGAAIEIAYGIVDGRTLEAEFGEHLLTRFERGESSLAEPV
jgi:hypothetical protein